MDSGIRGMFPNRRECIGKCIVDILSTTKAVKSPIILPTILRDSREVSPFLQNWTFSDRKISLTGANSGIGLATAKQFVNEGAFIFITGRRDSKLSAAVKESGEMWPAYKETLRILAILIASSRRSSGRRARSISCSRTPGCGNC